MRSGARILGRVVHGVTGRKTQLTDLFRRPLYEGGAVDCGPSVATHEEVNSFVDPLVRLESEELHQTS
jgi:hypothetical protein